MGNGKTDVWLGTLSLMILKTLQTMGALHGYGVARRIEQISQDRLALNYGTLYPALLKLEQDRHVRWEWGVSENNRKAKFYSITPAGLEKLEKAEREWAETASIVACFLAPTAKDA